jgi:hypothetical protein
MGWRGLRNEARSTCKAAFSRKFPSKNNPGCGNPPPFEAFVGGGPATRRPAFVSCLAEVSSAAKLIHPHPGRYRLEKVQGRAAGNPE